ncbi:MAG: transcriptional repressor [Saprospiraceae bacterium]|nr:transcriptional repressor [Saprospiraceae bacterium]
MANSEALLKKHNMRVTQFRVDVADIISESKHALSSNDIEARLQDPDRITLYRTLKSFEDKGIIHKAIDGTNTAKYAMCESGCDEHKHEHQHLHFHCDSCGNTFCVEDVTIPEIRLPKGYSLTEVNIIASGKCKDC